MGVYGLSQLNGRHIKYCRAIAEGKSRKQATKAAGLAETTANNLAREPLIKAKIEELKSMAALRAELSVAKLIREQMALAFSDVGDLIDEAGNLRPLDQIPAETRKAITQFTISHDGRLSVKMADKQKAIEALGNLVGAANFIEEGGEEASALTERIKAARLRARKQPRELPPVAEDLNDEARDVEEGATDLDQSTVTGLPVPDFPAGGGGGADRGAGS